MTVPPLQGEKAPALDRDPEPVQQTPRPGARLALQDPSLCVPCGCRPLPPHPGETDLLSPELIFIRLLGIFLLIFYVFNGFLYILLTSVCQ